MINSRIPSNLLTARMAIDIVRGQNDLAQIQEKISTGKRVNRPSDAPAHAAHIISMQEATSKLEQYNRNATAAEAQLSLEESVLTNTTNSLMRIRELALSSNNGIASDQTRQAINSEIKLRLDEIYGLANSADSFGNFLFGGSNTQIKPFSHGNPTNYEGSDDVSMVPVASGRKIGIGDSGADVFMRIRAGNGDFNVVSDPTNAGTGLISFGSVTDTSLYTAQPYEIRFTSTSSYDLVNTATGTTEQSGVTYESGANIEFSGIMTSISGTPQPGDTFLIEPSRYQDVFSTVSSFVDALERSPSTDSEKARMQQDVNVAITNIDQAMDHINKIRATVGARLNAIDTSRDENAGVKLQIEKTRTDVEEIDIAEAITSLQTQANSLEILQKTFTRIEGLSLFNHM